MHYPIDWEREYDEAEGDHHLLWETGVPESLFVAFTCREIGGRAHVLDVGCGWGTDLVFLSGRGHCCTGVDISLAALTHARKRGEEQGAVFMLVQGDALSLPFGQDVFDVINDRGCFHHILPSRREPFVAEILRVLRKGGIYLLRCFSEKYFNSGGAGHRFTGNDVKGLFSPYFAMRAPVEYESIVDSIPVAMTWWIMKRL
ncbi:MAG: class I SAM-dependent methyltransferase [Candidatus Eremiobacteraeota bacterium]|nr:class I SAM-dependent methyltransferase [Candidatus Eremiobacteraeota bacterium]